MSFYSKVRGTFETLLQIGKGGPQLKNNAGVIEHRNAADAAFVIARALDPTGVDDLVTKRYGDANYGGGSSFSPHVIVSNTTVTAGASSTVSRYVEIAAGITLEIGADGDLFIA